MDAVCNFDDAAVYVVMFGVSGLPSWQWTLLGVSQYAALPLRRFTQQLVLGVRATELAMDVYRWLQYVALMVACGMTPWGAGVSRQEGGV